jgi:hypothetical protein
MAIVTAATMANDAVKILNQALDDAYNGKDREKRELIGGNTVVHGCRDRTNYTTHEDIQQQV